MNSFDDFLFSRSHVFEFDTINEPVIEININDKSLNQTGGLLRSIRKTQLEKGVNLRFVDLSDNCIMNIEVNSFYPLVNLNTLDLSNNRLTEVVSISCCYNLEFLYLHHNQISDISSVNKLNKLIILDVSDNNIYELNDHIFTKLNNLSTLNLSNNYISKIDHSTWKGLIQLSFLNLNNNMIVEVESIKHMPRLKTLYLCGNRLTRIHSLNKLKGLITIDVSNNYLENIDFMKSLVTLISIYLNNNMLKVFDHLIFNKHNQLLYINLSFNQITQIRKQDIIKCIPSIIELNIEYNPLELLIIYKEEIICNCSKCDNLCRMCCICLDEYDIYYQIPACNHFVCLVCADMIKSCPMCKGPFFEYLIKNENNIM